MLSSNIVVLMLIRKLVFMSSHYIAPYLDLSWKLLSPRWSHQRPHQLLALENELVRQLNLSSFGSGLWQCASGD